MFKRAGFIGLALGFLGLSACVVEERPYRHHRTMETEVVETRAVVRSDSAL